jgi:large subunit ribosomal protein L15
MLAARRLTTARSTVVKSLTHSLSTFNISNVSQRHNSTATTAASQQPEVLQVLRLNNLSDNAGAISTKRRVGRGIGSSKGKTCGRGHKGQKARSGGGVHPTFEGGQTKFYKRLPKRGFTNQDAEIMLGVNVGTIQDYIDMKRLLPNVNGSPWTMKDFVDAGMFKSNSIVSGVKLLAGGKDRLRDALNLELPRASRAAIDAVEAVGGQITTVHYNRLALRALLKPEKFEVIPKRALPPPKRMVYYTDYDNRGYLSPELQLERLEKNMGSSEEAEETKGED